MSKTRSEARTRRPKRRVGSHPFDARIVTRVVRAAVRAAVRRHKASRNPIAIWRDGRVVIVPPEDIKV
jgi:hypothetical protein